jgi:hypothetical protein
MSSKSDLTLTDEQVAAARERRLEAMRLQEIEGNPLDAEQVAMFEMFERETWSHERRLAYIAERAARLATFKAAE